MPKTEKELTERDKTRDIGAELLEAVQQIEGRNGCPHNHR